MNPNTIIKTIGMNVRKKRLQLRLTQDALGELCGLDSRHIGFIERGCINSTVKTLQKVSGGLGCSLKALFNGI